MGGHVASISCLIWPHMERGTHFGQGDNCSIMTFLPNIQDDLFARYSRWPFSPRFKMTFLHEVHNLIQLNRFLIIKKSPKKNPAKKKAREKKARGRKVLKRSWISTLPVRKNCKKVLKKVRKSQEFWCASSVGTLQSQILYHVFLHCLRFRLTKGTVTHPSWRSF